MDIKQELAAEAVKIVTGARRAAYGRPEQNFERIARLWNAHNANVELNTRVGYGGERGLTPGDVALYMILMKVARLAETPSHRDSVLDILGYALCYGELEIAQNTIEADQPVDVSAAEMDAIEEAAARGEPLTSYEVTEALETVRAVDDHGEPLPEALADCEKALIDHCVAAKSHGKTATDTPQCARDAGPGCEACTTEDHDSPIGARRYYQCSHPHRLTPGSTSIFAGPRPKPEPLPAWQIAQVGDYVRVSPATYVDERVRGKTFRVAAICGQRQRVFVETPFRPFYRLDNMDVAEVVAPLQVDAK